MDSESEESMEEMGLGMGWSLVTKEIGPCHGSVSLRSIPSSRSVPNPP